MITTLLFLAILLLFVLFFRALFQEKLEAGFCSESEILSFWNRGIPLTGKNKRTSLLAAFRHILVVGQSGSGKSQVVFLPALLRATGKISYVVHDPSGEIRKSTSGYLKKRGYSIKVLNLSNPRASNYYNPLQRVDNTLASAKKLAKVMVSASLGNAMGEAQFWHNKADHLLSILVLLTKKLDKKYHHPATVLYLLNTLTAEPISMDVMAAEYLKSEKELLEYKAIIRTDPKLMSNIISTAKAALSLYEDEQIAKVCSKDDISFSELRKRPTVIFLESSIMQLKYNAPLFSLALTQLMETLLAELPKMRELPVALLLDEFGILSLGDSYSDFLSNSRKYRVSCVLGVQTTGQIITKYGKEEGGNILANTYIQMYFGNQPIETCQILEKMAGYVNIENKDGKSERHLVLPATKVRLLPMNRAVIMAGGFMPALVKLRPAYKSFVLTSRMNLPFEQNVSKDKHSEIPLPYIPKPKRVK